MATKSIIHRFLAPGETLAELLFGLIMMLTFTVGARLLTERNELNAKEVVIAAVGCNIAWGIIDAALYLMGIVFIRSQRAHFLRALKGASDEKAAMELVQDEFDLDEPNLAIPAEDRESLYRHILAAVQHATPIRTKLRRDDFMAAVVVFFLVSATAVPAIIPFLFLDDTYLALRVGNFLLLVLLFVVGYWWAHFTDTNPWRVGSVLTALGLAMVLVAIALGG